jgi:serine/threonine protein kinase
MLDALAFLACLGITHCDVKTANICIVNAERRIFKLIDFGSAVLNYDAHMSCVQVHASDCFLMVP